MSPRRRADAQPRFRRPGAPLPAAPAARATSTLRARTASGRPGTPPRKVWFTVADGVLSDTYWPTSTRPTSTRSSTWSPTAQLHRPPDPRHDLPGGPGPDRHGVHGGRLERAAHHYRITTTYIADPARDAVLMRPASTGRAGDQLYVRLDPLAGGTGGGGSQNAGGNSASLGRPAGRGPGRANTNTTTNAVNRDYAVPTFEALESSRGFSSASVGYAGTRQRRPDDARLAPTSSPRYDSAPDGHVTLTAELRLRHGPQRAPRARLRPDRRPRRWPSPTRRSSSSFDAARSPVRAAVAALRRGLRRPASLARPRRGPRVLRVGQRRQGERGQDLPGRDRRRAGLAMGPVGPRRQPDKRRADLLRLLPRGLRPRPVRGVHRPAGRRRHQHRPGRHRFLFDRQQQADGSMPRNSLLNGKPAPDTGGLQLDETSYPILMDWQSGLAGDTVAVHPARDPGGRLPGRARALGRRRALGGAVAATRPRRSRPRSRA